MHFGGRGGEVFGSAGQSRVARALGWGSGEGVREAVRRKILWGLPLMAVGSLDHRGRGGRPTEHPALVSLPSLYRHVCFLLTVAHCSIAHCIGLDDACGVLVPRHISHFFMHVALARARERERERGASALPLSVTRGRGPFSALRLHAGAGGHGRENPAARETRHGDRPGPAAGRGGPGYPLPPGPVRVRRECSPQFCVVAYALRKTQRTEDTVPDVYYVLRAGCAATTPDSQLSACAVCRL